MDNLVPITKCRPPATQETVERTTLVEQLYQAVLKHRLTLISAPAGSGKTTLAADLARSGVDATVKWLSLDEGDNELQAFMLAMLLTILDAPESDLVMMVQQGQMQPRQLATVLINRVAATSQSPFILVLDDLHHITDGAIHEYLDYVIQHLPAHGHILVTTRYDPPLSLAKLRARGELAEIRLDTLRFDRDEVDVLLNKLLKLDIADDLIVLMVERTEGWIAGLRLLALSLERIYAGKRKQYIADLAHQDRYIFDLLVEEVLAQQSDEIRQFLLETSILDELTPAVCTAVTQQPDVMATLRELHRQNLFLVSLGDGAYRYHALFRDFLQEQLKRRGNQILRERHYRAAMAHTSSIQKLNHFIAAEAWDDAIRLCADVAVANIDSLIAARLGPVVARMPGDMRDNNPWLLVIRGGLYAQQGHNTLAGPLLKKASELFKQHGDRTGETIAVGLMVGTQPNMPYEEYVAIFEWMRNQSATMRPGLQIPLLSDAMWNSVWNYQLDRTEHYLVELVDMVILRDNPPSYRTIAQYIAEPLFCTGRGAQPFEHVLPYMARHTESDAIVRMGVYNIKAILAVLHGKLEQGRYWLALSHEINQSYGGFAWMNTLVYGTLLTISLIRRDSAAFDRHYEEAIQVLGQQDTARLKLAEFLYLRGRRLLYDNRMDEAQQLADEMRQHILAKEHERLHIALEGYIAQSNSNLDKAVFQMQRAVAFQLPIYQLPASYTMQLSLAFLQWQCQERDKALRTFQQALRPLVEWNYPGIAVQSGRETASLYAAAADAGIYPEFCRSCLDILCPDAEIRPVTIPGSSEILTSREVEVLRLVCNGASNRAIAAELVITERTVKSHITRILAKLDASSRTAAAARARELGIVL